MNCDSFSNTNYVKPNIKNVIKVTLIFKAKHINWLKTFINTSMNKAFKFRLFPNKEQQVLIEKHFGCSRFIYNFALGQRIETYEKEKTTLSKYELQEQINDKLINILFNDVFITDHIYLYFNSLCWTTYKVGNM